MVVHGDLPAGDLLGLDTDEVVAIAGRPYAEREVAEPLELVAVGDLVHGAVDHDRVPVSNSSVASSTSKATSVPVAASRSFVPGPVRNTTERPSRAKWTGKTIGLPKWVSPTRPR